MEDDRNLQGQPKTTHPKGGKITDLQDTTTEDHNFGDEWALVVYSGVVEKRLVEEHLHDSPDQLALMGSLKPLEKLDVFSFGIVLLAIVSGRKSSDHTLPPDQIYLPNWVLELSEQKMLLNLVDFELVEMYNEEEALLVIQTALACVQMDQKRRPSMSQVVNTFTKHEDVAIEIVREINSPTSDRRHVFSPVTWRCVLMSDWRHVSYPVTWRCDVRR
ncbi:hypothetical protein R1sor_013798 [Riccia sorocarpa]|uniref:Protein kinase domain-containing protein n=1 Tax=Riccia sorocarpa TaxID=122646 RepID=A0ABD3HBF4_9MARC